MNRADFMAGLRCLLADISEAEREEALNYYEDYFDDAGVENEASVIEALGTPEKVAAIIKDGLNDSEGANGEFTENGYSNPTYESKDELRERTFIEKVKKSDKKNGIWIVILILCLFGLPVVVPLAVGLLSAAFGILCAIVAVIFAVLISGVAIVVTGVALGIAGILSIIATPVVGILFIGAGLIVGGIGVLIAILGAWIIGKVVPFVVRSVVDLLRKIFVRRRD